jgi:sortase A
MMDRKLRSVERILWAVAAVCVGCSAFAWHMAHAALPSAPLSGNASAVTVSTAPGERIGQLVIPAVGLSVPVVEDDDTDSLLHGVGHIRGTAFPGGLGTVGLAGHRDTFLRPLANVRPSMQIQLSRGDHTYRYLVDSTEIVHPEAVRVLDIVNTPELVLVTCYPFHYIGAAPLRFIVHAHLVSLAPEAENRAGRR